MKSHALRARLSRASNDSDASLARRPSSRVARARDARTKIHATAMRAVRRPCDCGATTRGRRACSDAVARSRGRAGRRRARSIDGVSRAIDGVIDGFSRAIDMWYRSNVRYGGYVRPPHVARRMKDKASASAGAYAHVVRGKLKLKASSSSSSAASASAKGVTKKKHTKASKRASREDDGRPGTSSGGGDRRTAAEKAYDAYKSKHEDRLIASMASASHKDKVAAFNEKLSKLSEHHDIPKVGPG